MVLVGEGGSAGEKLYSMSDVEYLLANKVSKFEGGHYCMLCGVVIKSNVRRHMENKHVASDTRYYCPTCDRTFKNRCLFSNHVYKKHVEWKGVSFDDFAVRA